MKISHPLFLIVLALLATSGGVSAECAFQEAVAFQDTHDPGFIVLADGRGLEVAFLELSWEAVGKWPHGRALVLAFHPERGLELTEKAAGFAEPILAVDGKHPIDAHLEECQAGAGTTLAMNDCFAAAEKCWDVELNRNYRLLMRQLGEEHKALLQSSQRKWIEFRDAQIATLRARFLQEEGTIHTTLFIGQVLDLTRAQALRLGRYVKPL